MTKFDPGDLKFNDHILNFEDLKLLLEARRAKGTKPFLHQFISRKHDHMAK